MVELSAGRIGRQAICRMTSCTFWSMRNMKRIDAFAALVMVLALSACSKPTEVRPSDSAAAGSGSAPAAASIGQMSAGAASGTGRPLSTGSAVSTEQQIALSSVRQRNVVYFGYDASEISAEYLPVVAAHASYLVKYPRERVRLEGHTDERGSREYNIGLGERRAQTVRKALLLQGVADAQITTVSYGEERPAVDGSDDTAYARNRRVEFSYPQQ